MAKWSDVKGVPKKPEKYDISIRLSTFTEKLKVPQTKEKTANLMTASLDYLIIGVCETPHAA